MSRISYRNMVPLSFTQSKSYEGTKDLKGLLVLDEDTEELEHNIDANGYSKVNRIIEKMYLLRNDFKKVDVVSSAFVDAAVKARKQLIPLILKDIESGSGLNFSGTLICNNGAYLYRIGCAEGKADVMEISQFHKDGCLYGHASAGAGEDYFMDKTEASTWLKERAFFILLFMYFKKYAKVETLESKARTKIHAHGCKYLNETDLDIEYLDSKWFTTLVNSKGFKVGGHFRLQPKKKDGEWTKELIWIEDFEKKGYNRKAGILC